MGEARQFPCLTLVLLGQLPTSVRWAQHLLAPTTQLNPSTLEEGKEEGCSRALPRKAETSLVVSLASQALLQTTTPPRTPFPSLGLFPL